MQELSWILAGGPFYTMPLWGKIVGPILLVAAGAGLITLFFIARKRMAPKKPDAKLAWYHWAWIHGALVLGIVAVIIAVGYVVAAADPSFLGING